MEELYEFIHDMFSQFHVPFRIIKSSNGEDLLYEMSEVGDFDLIFLDIELGIDNGIEVAKEVRKRSPYCQIIFVSGYNQYYKDAFSVQPFQFLDKPIQKAELEQVVNAVAKLIIDSNQVFAFEYRWKSYRIRLNDIVYIMSNHRKLSLYEKSGACYTFYGTIKDVQVKLQNMSTSFSKVHNRYLINMNYIKVFEGDKIVLQDGSSIPVASREKSKVALQYMSFVNH